MAYSVSAYERETTITFNEAEDVAHVFTASPSWMRKFDKLCRENPDQYHHTDDSKVAGEVVGKFYEMDKNLVTVRSKTRQNTMTEEQRQAAAERLRAMRHSQTEQTAQDTI